LKTTTSTTTTNHRDLKRRGWGGVKKAKGLYLLIYIHPPSFTSALLLPQPTHSPSSLCEPTNQKTNDDVFPSFNGFVERTGYL
jgi:hypothetical protein